MKYQNIINLLVYPPNQPSRFRTKKCVEIKMERVELTTSIFKLLLKVHQCKYENVSKYSSSDKNNMSKVSHYNTIYFLIYTHPRYMERLFINIQKQ